MLQYLYLLFDENNLIHRDDSNYVFTTEGHLLTLDNKHLKPISDVRRRLRGAENLQCPAYSPPMVLSQDGQNGLRGGIRSRGDVEYARLLVGGTPNDADKAAWSPDGFCDVPHGELYVSPVPDSYLLLAYKTSPTTLFSLQTVRLLMKISTLAQTNLNSLMMDSCFTT